MDRTQRLLLWFMRGLCVAILILDVLLWREALARDAGQWDDATPADVRIWFKTLMQPDNPMVSCCGEGDAWHADSFEVSGDQYVAIITDTRDDVPLIRRHIEPGTKFIVPNSKLKIDAGNPTGHGVIFIGGAGNVLCYIAPGGG